MLKLSKSKMICMEKFYHTTTDMYKLLTPFDTTSCHSVFISQVCHCGFLSSSNWELLNDVWMGSLLSIAYNIYVIIRICFFFF